MTKPSTKAEEVTTEAKVTITHRELTQKALALSALSGRALPSLDSDMKVGRLHKIHEVEAHLLEKPRNQISIRILKDMDLKKLTGIEAERIMGTIAIEQADFDRMTIPWEKNKWHITKADLPKEKSGDEGWKNGAGLGAIISGLGDLFQDDTKVE